MKLGAYFDPLGETEPGDTVYTVTVRLPYQPSKWRSSFLARALRSPSAYTVIPDESNQCEHLEKTDLRKMRTKIFKIKSADFPISMRCEHLQARRRCAEGCYILANKGKEVGKCSRSDCEEQMYPGTVKKDDEGKECFGRKGKRLIRVSN